MTRLPTEEQCLQYFEEFKVPSKIKEHCVKVKEAAVFVAKELNKQGLNINLEFDMSSEDNFKKALSILKGKSPG